MQLSLQALKDWQQVTTSDQMISWHLIYTPWLTKSQILLLGEVYEKQIQDLQAKNKLQLVGDQVKKKKKKGKKNKKSIDESNKENEEPIIDEFMRLMLKAEQSCIQIYFLCIIYYKYFFKIFLKT